MKKKTFHFDVESLLMIELCKPSFWLIVWKLIAFSSAETYGYTAYGVFKKKYYFWLFFEDSVFIPLREFCQYLQFFDILCSSFVISSRLITERTVDTVVNVHVDSCKKGGQERSGI